MFYTHFWIESVYSLSLKGLTVNEEKENKGNEAADSWTGVYKKKADKARLCSFVSFVIFFALSIVFSMVILVDKNYNIAFLKWGLAISGVLSLFALGWVITTFMFLRVKTVKVGDETVLVYLSLFQHSLFIDGKLQKKSKGKVLDGHLLDGRNVRVIIPLRRRDLFIAINK